MKTFETTLALLCGVFLGGGELLWANGGGYSSGVNSTGAFKPLHAEKVEMVSEQLEIDLHKEYAEVRIEYVFHNPGKSVSVEVAMPCSITRYHDTGFHEKAPTDPRLDDLSITADGKDVETKFVYDDLSLKRLSEKDNVIHATSWNPPNVSGWHPFKLKFSEGQTRLVKVSYRAPYYFSKSYISSNGSTSPLTFTYLFSTAAVWSGPIQHGTVIVNAVTADADQVQFNQAKRFKREGATWTWNFTDFKPTLSDDLVISVRPGMSNFSHVEGNENGHNTYRSIGANEEKTSKGAGQWWLLRRDGIKATATSQLPNEGEFNYEPKNVLGWNQDAWVEGVKGDGIGEAITLTFEKPTKVTRVAFVNGFARTRELYEANGRVAKLDLSVNGGPPKSISIPDEHLQHEQWELPVPEPNDRVKTLTFTIREVYPGGKYDDTAITGIWPMTPLSKAPTLAPVR